jgi:hypothetical protein
MKVDTYGTAQKMEVSSHVVLDSSWDIRTDLHDEAVDVEFRASGSSVGFFITEDMIEKLSAVFAEATEHFRRLDAKPEHQAD